MSEVQIQWLAEVNCPRCGDRVTVPVIVDQVRVYDDGVRRSLVADFHPADVSHRCPDPTKDRTGAAR